MMFNYGSLFRNKYVQIAIIVLVAIVLIRVLKFIGILIVLAFILFVALSLGIKQLTGSKK